MTHSVLFSSAVVAVGATLMYGCGSPRQQAPEAASEGTKIPRLDFDDVMVFEQGVPASYQVTATLPGDLTPQLTAENLPEGATLVEGTLAWTPPCSWRLEDGYFFRGYEVVRIRFVLTAQERDDVSLSRYAALIVHRDMDPNGPCASAEAEAEAEAP